MPNEKKHITIVSGEASGDLHAASLVRNLRAQYPEIQFDITGIGGKHLQQEGVNILNFLAETGVTGATEVLRHAFTLRRAYKIIQNHLQNHPPDLLILVDYPGFNLRLAKFAKAKLGLRILYYISPQIWAWKAGRIETIRKHIDHMAAILPFEKKIYDQAHVPCSFVGHPLLSNLAHAPTQKQARLNLNLPLNKQIVALLPGSRKNEIRQHLPVLNKAALLLLKSFPELKFILPIANTLTENEIKAYLSPDLPIHLVHEQAIDAIAASNCVAVASGTASLECALLEKPMCIIYKASPLTYIIATQLMRVQYLGLCNLIAKRMIVPELMQYDCAPEQVAEVLKTLLTDTKTQTTMIQNLQALKASLNSANTTCSLAEVVYQMLNPIPSEQNNH